MKVMWNRVSFECSCGLQGTIMEVCVSQDGGIVLTGLCVVCGREFSVEDNMANLIAKSAIRDYVRCVKETPEETLADFVPKGKPS